MKRFFRPLVATLVVALGPLCFPLAPRAAQADRQTPPDNTAVNKRDRTATAQTADQQSNGRSDLETSRQIRRAIVNDKSLSTYAHNIKIITQHGQVTLKGPVRSTEEKAAIEAKATSVAGAANVTNQVSVVPRKTSSGKSGQQ
jgi:hyperosmotically inducible protein